MDTVTLKPERKAQLEEVRAKHGKDPAEALDEALAAYFDSEQRTLRKRRWIQRGLEDVRAGRIVQLGVPGPTPSEA